MRIDLDLGVVYNVTRHVVPNGIFSVLTWDEKGKLQLRGRDQD